MQTPAERRAADRFEAIGELVVAGGRGARAGGPDDDLAGGPRCLEADLTGHLRQHRGGCRARGAVQELVEGVQARQVVLDVGFGELALEAVALADRCQVVLGVGDQAVERALPAGGVLFQHRQLLGRGAAFRRGPGR